jgi:hypothetical protein
MRKTTLRWILLIPALAILNCCQPEEPDPEGQDVPLIFKEVTASRTQIFTEDTTSLHAHATGYKLTFHWSVEKGDLIGTGQDIIFVATPCTVGNNTISCTVMDGNQKSETRQVTVTVY